MIARKIIAMSAMAVSLAGCYAYAGPPRHTHYRHERVVVHQRPQPRPVVIVHQRPRPAVVRERVVVRETRRRPRHHHDHD
jgi:ABC-type uncharacterized transport system auxiliary subunit